MMIINKNITDILMNFDHYCRLYPNTFLLYDFSVIIFFESVY
jgi:hypothetical protein